MLSDQDNVDKHGPASLSDAAKLARLTVIGAALAAVAAHFAYTAGWISAHRVRATRPVDHFQTADGVFPGLQCNHTTGVCTGGDVNATGRVPIIGLVLLGGGLPYVADSKIVQLARTCAPTASSGSSRDDEAQGKLGPVRPEGCPPGFSACLDCAGDSAAIYVSDVF